MSTVAVSSVACVVVGVVLQSLAPAGGQLTRLTEIRLTDSIVDHPGGGPEAIACDGTSVWVADQFDNRVTRLDAATGTRLGTVAVRKRSVAPLAGPSEVLGAQS